MISVIPTEHPYWLVRDTVAKHRSEISLLHFSYYNYVPQTVVDNRRLFEVSTEDFLDPNSMEYIISTTPVGQELAFHSNVLTFSSEKMHIPMVDMSTNSIAHLAKLIPILGEHVFQQFNWFLSGRSFHGYGRFLVPERKWVELMGTLLLANKKGLVEVVDPRWVGHRLMAGYSALRWTKNTSHYITLPRKLE